MQKKIKLNYSHFIFLIFFSFVNWNSNCFTFYCRTKLKQTEVDCEYLKRCCETLTDENRRLHKELQELRALKTSNPFYMQLPATTLTMCPSCERVASTTTTTSAATAPPITATTATTTTSDSIPKAIPFLNSRPRFFPFTTTNNNPNHSHQSAASWKKNVNFNFLWCKYTNHWFGFFCLRDFGRVGFFILSVWCLVGIIIYGFFYPLNILRIFWSIYMWKKKKEKVWEKGL